MNEIAQARLDLHRHLLEYTAHVLLPDRVHLYSPSILAAPSIWIGQPGVTAQVLGRGTKVRVVRFGVYVVADGFDPVQCELLDELVALVWDAGYAMNRAEALISVPQAIDVGGSSQRGVVTDIGVTTMAGSLCTRPPVTASTLLHPALA